MRKTTRDIKEEGIVTNVRHGMKDSPSLSWGCSRESFFSIHIPTGHRPYRRRFSSIHVAAWETFPWRICPCYEMQIQIDLIGNYLISYCARCWRWSSFSFSLGESLSPISVNFQQSASSVKTEPAFGTAAGSKAVSCLESLSVTELHMRRNTNNDKPLTTTFDVFVRRWKNRGCVNLWS